MGADLTIRQGDTAPALTWQLTDGSGNPLDLVGATVTWVMRQLTSDLPVVNAAATTTNAAGGWVTYQWSPSDTATAGMYTGEFHVTFPGGGKLTYPADGYLEVSVEENLTTSGGSTIVSLGEVKDYLRIGSGDRSRDAALIRFIRASVPVIEGIVGAVLTRTFEEWYDGGQVAIRLRNRPVISLLACSMYMGPVEYPMTVIDTPAEGTIYSVMLDAEGRVTRRTTGGGVDAFPTGNDSVHIVYQVGRNPVPLNIREGNLELLRVNYQRAEQAGRPGIGGGQSAGDEDAAPTVPTGFFVPGRVREMLAPHRRHPSLA